MDKTKIIRENTITFSSCNLQVLDFISPVYLWAYAEQRTKKLFLKNRTQCCLIFIKIMAFDNLICAFHFLVLIFYVFLCCQKRLLKNLCNRLMKPLKRILGKIDLYHYKVTNDCST